MSEQEIIHLLQNGSQEAFRIFVDENKRNVYNTTLGILQNSDDAEDITQEVFIEVFRSVKNFKGESKLTTWLYRIAVTKSLELIRSRKRKKRYAVFQNLFSADEGKNADESKSFFHPGVTLENKELNSILFKAISALPENQKAAFTLHKVEGLSYKEIGEILNLSLSSVESLIHRAKNNLKLKLNDYYENNYK